MKTSMTLFGCGPRLALICLPYVILSLIVMYKYPEFFDLRFLNFSYAKVIGFTLLGLGVIYWIYSAYFFLKFFKPGSLITKGPFALCRNPIYSSIIVFIIPSLALIFHSGLIFSISIVLYIGFKISIHGETIVLRRLFGEEYGIYEKSVNEIIPFPQNFHKRKAIQ
jgi:protein-S-isoprenylcysteine O-methyltransferase Ste14